MSNTDAQDWNPSGFPEVGNTCRCGLPSVLRPVKNQASANLGRCFYTCPKSNDQPDKCTYFAWADTKANPKNFTRTYAASKRPWAPLPAPPPPPSSNTGTLGESTPQPPPSKIACTCTPPPSQPSPSPAATQPSQPSPPPTQPSLPSQPPVIAGHLSLENLVVMNQVTTQQIARGIQEVVGEMNRLDKCVWLCVGGNKFVSDPC
jgi:hypothetical protein